MGRLVRANVLTVAAVPPAPAVRPADDLAVREADDGDSGDADIRTGTCTGGEFSSRSISKWRDRLNDRTPRDRSRSRDRSADRTGDDLVQGRHLQLARPLPHRQQGPRHAGPLHVARPLRRSGERRLARVVVKPVRPHPVDDGRSPRRPWADAEPPARPRRPVIARGREAGLEGPRPDVVLEHPEGPRPSSAVRRHGRLQPEQLVPPGRRLASAPHRTAGGGRPPRRDAGERDQGRARAPIDLSIARRPADPPGATARAPVADLVMSCLAPPPADRPAPAEVAGGREAIAAGMRREPVLGRFGVRPR